MFERGTGRSGVAIAALLWACFLPAAVSLAADENAPAQVPAPPKSDDVDAPEKSAPPAPSEGQSAPAEVEADSSEDSDEATAPQIRSSPAAYGPGGPPPEFRGPDVTLIASEKRTVYEYRQHGQLRMVKIVPKRGKPYYLVPRDPTRGFGDLEQADTLLAEWVLWEF